MTGNSNERTERRAVYRFWKIHYLVAHGFYPNVRTLAERLEVHRRTVERDLEQMRVMLNAPLEFDRKRNGYYYREKYDFPPIRFSEEELTALFLGQELLRRMEGTVSKESLGALREKLLALPEVGEDAAEFLAATVSFHVQPLRGGEERVTQYFSLFREAIRARREVKIQYRSMSGPESAGESERMIRPYYLRYHDGAWYVIAWCRLREEVRIFALDRMGNVELGTEVFPEPVDFDLETYLAGVRGIIRGRKYQVVVRFDPYQARWIRERPLGTGEEIQEESDGGILFCAEVSGLLEIKQWVLSFGGRAEVLAPEELRAEIRVEVEKLKEIYETDTGRRGGYNERKESRPDAPFIICHITRGKHKQWTRM